MSDLLNQDPDYAVSSAKPAHGEDHRDPQGSRRDFLFLAAGGMAAMGGAVAVWPLIDTMNPAADTLALSTTEVDLAPIAEGQAITVVWRGKPVFIRHRTQAEIDAAQHVDVKTLVDPATDDSRVKPGAAQWLIMVGICTHLGCVPLGQKPGDPKGEFGGWFCPCHGSQYDTSGRIRKGPAPRNLLVPDYKFTDDAKTKVVIG